MVCSLTLCFLATFGTNALSASGRIATICSSVKQLFFIGSSLIGGSHSLKLRSVQGTPAGQEDLATNGLLQRTLANVALLAGQAQPIRCENLTATLNVPP